MANSPAVDHSSKVSCDSESDEKVPKNHIRKRKKKRALANHRSPSKVNIIDAGNIEIINEDSTEASLNEPTMGEKLACLNLQETNKADGEEKHSLSSPKHPSADSIYLLLRQAINADDHALLYDCLHTQDEKVIYNSLAKLNPHDVLKLLRSFVSIVELRGAVLVCAIPWLKSLLLQHASEITSQESSLALLNALYQLIESRVSCLESAIQLSTSLDVIHTEQFVHKVEESKPIIPVIYEDDDDDESGEPEEGAMEADEEEDAAFEEEACARIEI